MPYLDHNATTQPSPAVVRAMTHALESLWQNPSSLHRAGQTVRREVDRARASVAHLIGARAPEICFTASGTESLDLAVRGSLRCTTRRRIISTPMEHGALRTLLRTLASDNLIDLDWTPLLPGGIVDLDRLAPMLDDTVALVSIQWANNETGAVQPIDQLGALCRQRNVRFHCDATQWVGKMPTNVGTAPDQQDRPDPIAADMLTFAGHKFHGPKGIGVLWIRRGCRVQPVIHGTQELSRRGGTENTPAIIGLGVACDEARQWLADPAARDRAQALRDRFEQHVLAQIEGASVNAPPAPHRRLWSTSNIAFPGIDAEAMLLALSERELCASAGSACSSGSIDPSPVLRAAGVDPERAGASIRFSFCRNTTQQEVDEGAAIVCQCAASLAQAIHS